MIQSWGRPAPRGRGDPHTALRCPVSKERDGFHKGSRRRRAISGAGLTLSRLKGIASPVGEIFRKKTDEGDFPRLPWPSPPSSGPHGGTSARGAPKRANHALLSTFFSLLSILYTIRRHPRNAASLIACTISPSVPFFFWSCRGAIMGTN